MIALIFSSIVGIFAALIKEKRNNYIYELEDFQKIIECKFIDTIYNEKPNLSADILQKLFNRQENKRKNFIIAESSFRENYIFKYLNEKTKIEFINIDNIDNINSINNLSNFIIIIESGTYKNNQLILLNKYYSLYKENFIGWIYNDRKLKFDK